MVAKLKLRDNSGMANSGTGGRMVAKLKLNGKSGMAKGVPGEEWLQS